MAIDHHAAPRTSTAEDRPVANEITAAISPRHQRPVPTNEPAGTHRVRRRKRHNSPTRPLPLPGPSAGPRSRAGGCSTTPAETQRLKTGHPNEIHHRCSCSRHSHRLILKSRNHWPLTGSTPNQTNAPHLSLTCLTLHRQPANPPEVAPGDDEPPSLGLRDQDHPLPNEPDERWSRHLLRSQVPARRASCSSLTTAQTTTSDLTHSWPNPTAIGHQPPHTGPQPAKTAYATIGLRYERLAPPPQRATNR